MNQGGALVHVYTDGTVLVSHGGTEMVSRQINLYHPRNVIANEYVWLFIDSSSIRDKVFIQKFVKSRHKHFRFL